MELTPASARPWISGTSDNRVLSLIFEYNGLGRVDGQAGGPGGPGAATCSAARRARCACLNSALGGQAGWLLGFAAVAGLAILAASRLRRTDPRSGWLLAVGGASLMTAVLFSSASGIFHPYYVSLLAPFVAALAGAGAAQMIGGGRGWRRGGGSRWAPSAWRSRSPCATSIRASCRGSSPVLLARPCRAGLVLLPIGAKRVRLAALAVLAGALLLAPSAWALDTLGHATSGTFPAGGPASAESAAAGPSVARAAPARARACSRGGAPGCSAPPRAARKARHRPEPARPRGAPPGRRARAARRSRRAGRGRGAGAGPERARRAERRGGPFGGASASLQTALGYAREHGGGTVAVSSQSAAASAIVQDEPTWRASAASRAARAT